MNDSMQLSLPYYCYVCYDILPWGEAQGVTNPAFGHYAFLHYGCGKDITI